MNIVKEILETKPPEEKVGRPRGYKHKPTKYSMPDGVEAYFWACGYEHVSPARLDIHLNTAENEAREWVPVQTSPHPIDETLICRPCSSSSSSIYFMYDNRLSAT